MTLEYSKPAVRDAWADAPLSPTTDVIDPGNTYVAQGWQAGVKPPRPYFNWLLNYSAAAVRYFCQQGIADWDPLETYQINGISQGSNNRLYQSLINNNTNQNPTTSPSAWGPVQGAAPANSDNSNSLSTTAWVTTNFVPRDASFSVLSGQIANGQVPVGAVTQWQGSLTINGTQITGIVPQAAAVTASGGGPYVFHFSAIAQPSWALGTNDGVTISVSDSANWSVANAATLAGLAPSTGATGSTIAERDSSGYLYSGYFNQSSANNENPSISQVMVTNGTDNFLRKSTTAHLLETLMLSGAVTFEADPGGTPANGTAGSLVLYY
jgi:hypothetical protein